MAKEPLVEELLARIPGLSAMRLEVIALMTRAFSVEVEHDRDEASDFAQPDFVEALGDVLLIHHTLSQESFTKDKFEHAIETVLRRQGFKASLAPRGNPGHDLTVESERWSLKTQADQSIKDDRLHVSKFMELGRGDWGTEADLPGLRDRMLAHMKNYDRIFSLRCLSAARHRRDSGHHEYELVEIPKDLLERSKEFACVMQMSSRQTPKPGTCTVLDAEGGVLLQLYFDGGTERKLQVRHLAKDACRVHAWWRFPRAERAS